jgi:hypothetical protein
MTSESMTSLLALSMTSEARLAGPLAFVPMPATASPVLHGDMPREQSFDLRPLAIARPC